MGLETWRQPVFRDRVDGERTDGIRFGRPESHAYRRREKESYVYTVNVFPLHRALQWNMMRFFYTSLARLD